MSQEKVNPQSPEEITKAAQEAAIKAAMEQAQSMLGSIPGFQIPDIAAMQEQIRAQMQVAVPNLSEIQAQQAAMGTLVESMLTTSHKRGKIIWHSLHR